MVLRNWNIARGNCEAAAAVLDQINWFKFGHVEIKILPLTPHDKTGESWVKIFSQPFSQSCSKFGGE